MSDGIGMRVRAATLSSLGRTTSFEIMWPRKSTRAAPILDLSRESFNWYRRRRAKKAANVVT